MKNNILYIVVPCYNEEEVLEITAKELKQKLNNLIDEGYIDAKSKVLFVDDGSKDKTWSIIEKLHSEDSIFSGLKLSRNKGHQIAVFAGLKTAIKYADLTISIDADLQDDINAIDKMVKEYIDNDCDVVYGVRSSRKKDSFFKRFTAETFYKLMKKNGVETVFNHADFRLMSKRAVEALMQYEEDNIYLRGIIPQLGYKNATVEYERGKRLAGESKYPLKKMISLAVNGITSFSCKPLNLLFVFGLIFSLISFAGFVTTLVFYLLKYISMLMPLIFTVLFGVGIILLGLGIVGLYVGKTYIESKHRPKFFIDKELN